VTSHDSEGALRCEAMLYDYEPEWRPTGIVELDQTDVLAWKRPGWPAGFNRVAYAKWDERTAETRIEELFAFFGDAPFHWHVGPSSSPADLADRLIRRGLVVAARPRMMTIELPLPAGWPTNDAVRIAEVRDEAIARLSLELAHHNANDIARMLPERMAYITAPWRRGAMMVAYVGDVPVANAAWRYSSDGRCVYLTGADRVSRGYRSRTGLQGRGRPREQRNVGADPRASRFRGPRGASACRPAWRALGGARLRSVRIDAELRDRVRDAIRLAHDVTIMVICGWHRSPN